MFGAERARQLKAASRGAFGREAERGHEDGPAVRLYAAETGRDPVRFKQLVVGPDRQLRVRHRIGLLTPSSASRMTLVAERQDVLSIEAKVGTVADFYYVMQLCRRFDPPPGAAVSAKWMCS